MLSASRLFTPQAPLRALSGKIARDALLNAGGATLERARGEEDMLQVTLMTLQAYEFQLPRHTHLRRRFDGLLPPIAITAFHA